jgi:hypothetical protein
MTIEEFKEFLEANRDKDEVKALIQPDLTAETVSAFLESDKGRPIVDRYINAAVKSHDEKRKPEVDRLVTEAVEKARKESTMSVEQQLQQQMSELKNQIAQRDADLARRDMVSKLRVKADEMHVPLDLAVDLDNPNLTEERAIARMEAYAKTHAETISAEVNKRLTNGHKPGSGDSPEPGPDLRKLSFDEIVALEEKGELNARIAK